MWSDSVNEVCARLKLSLLVFVEWLFTCEGESELVLMESDAKRRSIKGPLTIP